MLSNRGQGRAAPEASPMEHSARWSPPPAPVEPYRQALQHSGGSLSTEIVLLPKWAPPLPRGGLATELSHLRTGY